MDDIEIKRPGVVLALEDTPEADEQDTVERDFSDDVVEDDIEITPEIRVSSTSTADLSDPAVRTNGAKIQRPPKERPTAEVPPSPPPAQPKGRRTLRLQLRFLRSLVFAARLFIRVLFWQWIVKRIAGEGFVRNRTTQRWKQYAREFRAFAADTGGVMIKLGQFISTRADIFPEEIINELTGLQDEIPAIDFTKIERVLRNELGEYEQRFRWLDDEPIAAASLGQVHRAQLHNGDRVVVKVQRPGIIDIIATDMAALLIVARVAMRFKFISRRTDAVAVTEEFGRVLWEEVSYIHEAQNADRFARMFQNNMGVYIPMVYHEHSTDRVLTLEDVTTIKVNDFERMDEAGINRNTVAKRLMNTYLQQIFDDRFFHADPHPGNLFVYPLPVEEGATFGPEGRPFYLIFIDFGMTGALTSQIVDGLISTLVAVVTRDAGQLIASYKELDLLLPSADTERLEEATKATFDQVWGMNMSDLSTVDYQVMEKLGEEFYDLLFDMPFQMPQNFIYLARTMGILSGMCTSLDPQFNPWSELQPYTRKLMRTRASNGMTTTGQISNSLMQSFFGTSNIIEAGAQVITRAVAPNASNEALIRQLQSGSIKVTAEPSRKLQIQLSMLEIQSKTIVRAVVFTGFLISTTILLVSGMYIVAGITGLLTLSIGWRVMFPPGIMK